MSTNLSFVDRVAIVTAAGEEPGRSIALELARRGASVIVNDPKPDEIVKEITKNGGKAFGIVNPVCTTGE